MGFGSGGTDLWTNNGVGVDVEGFVVEVSLLGDENVRSMTYSCPTYSSRDSSR